MEGLFLCNNGERGGRFLVWLPSESLCLPSPMRWECTATNATVPWLSNQIWRQGWGRGPVIVNDKIGQIITAVYALTQKWSNIYSNIYSLLLPFLLDVGIFYIKAKMMWHIPIKVNTKLIPKLLEWIPFLENHQMKGIKVQLVEQDDARMKNRKSIKEQNLFLFYHISYKELKHQFGNPSTLLFYSTTPSHSPAHIHLIKW